MARLPARWPRQSAHAPRRLSNYREFQDGEVVPGTRYRVTRLIGVGGMGRVYEVEHVELGKRFVLKALQPELARRDDLVARLRNEWRALARLEHPNIVGVTDAGTSDNDIPFYVMERLEGEVLSSLLHRVRRLIPPQALSIAAGILDGLHAAHQIGVVHRDVKPPNIFLTSAGTVKVLDFGIAKIQDAGGVITARGIAVGTPRYMSPEQAQGATVDARSDIYAVGLMLFEMVSGIGPFEEAKDNNELILAQLGRPAPLLSSVSVVAPELDALVASMLAKDPRERPANAGQVAETLRGLSVRYARYVDADAPTVSASRSATPEAPTRVDTPRRGSHALPPTRPDAPAALARPLGGDTTTVQPALELATTMPPVASANLAPSQRATLRLSEPLSTPPLFGPDTQVDPLTLVPTGSHSTAERTEILPAVAAPGELAADGGPTRTAVPLAVSAAGGEVKAGLDGPQLTPPPVVPSGVLPSRARSRVLPVAALLGLPLLVGAVLWSRQDPPVAKSAGARSSAAPLVARVQAAQAAAEQPMASSAPLVQTSELPSVAQQLDSAQPVMAASGATRSAAPPREKKPAQLDSQASGPMLARDKAGKIAGKGKGGAAMPGSGL